MAYPYVLSDPTGIKATLGLIVLQADETLENDLRALFPSADIALHFTRVPSAPEVHSDTLLQMKNHLGGAAGLFPDATRFDVVGYGCTSGTAVIGAPVVSAVVQGGCTTRAVTQPVSALVAACGHMGVRRLALLSPYVAEVSGRLRQVLAEAGIETPVFGSFDEAREDRVARIDAHSIHAAACDLTAQGGVDALFMSCTNLRTLGVIDRIEADTGLPVLSSNQVLAWHMAKQAGIALTAGPGRLLRGA